MRHCNSIVKQSGMLPISRYITVEENKRINQWACPGWCRKRALSCNKHLPFLKQSVSSLPYPSLPPIFTQWGDTERSGKTKIVPVLFCFILQISPSTILLPTIPWDTYCCYGCALWGKELASTRCQQELREFNKVRWHWADASSFTSMLEKRGCIWWTKEELD